MLCSLQRLEDTRRPLRKAFVAVFRWGPADHFPGLLLLHTPRSLYMAAFGAFLVAYAMSMFARPTFRLPHNSIFGRIMVGALGGITGDTSVFVEGRRCQFVITCRSCRAAKARFECGSGLRSGCGHRAWREQPRCGARRYALTAAARPRSPGCSILL